MVGSEDAGDWPFEKKVPQLWSNLESKEVFKKMPQKPHFRCLEQIHEFFREGEAIGCMVNFCSVVERSSRPQFLNEPISSTKEVSENLSKLEENGFRVEAVRQRLAMRVKLQELREQFEQVQAKIGKCVVEEAGIVKRMYMLSKELYEELKEAKDQEIASLKLKRIVLEEDISDVERDFLASVASPGLTDKYETSDKAPEKNPVGQLSSLRVVEKESKARGYADRRESREGSQTEVNKTKGAISSDQTTVVDDKVCVNSDQAAQTGASSDSVISEKERGEFVGVEDDEDIDIAESDSSHAGHLWDELSMVQFTEENSKDQVVESSSADKTGGNEGAKNCDHQFILKDDIGIVCRVCGLVGTRIEAIIDYPVAKKKEIERNYRYDRFCGNGSHSSSGGRPVPDGTRLGTENLLEVPVHPRHRKFMKDHQFDGLNFLMSNVMAENPGGCVMAHAPGSGKTFMIISFLQVFMTKFPSARPLIVLPRGILSTWKREFEKWQVEDLPLYDFYSSRAESRGQQLEVLRKWGKERSILFLSYKQFTVIVRDGDDDSETTEECRNFLLVSPSILILDEGHTTRNDDTETLLSVAKVKTPRKVVLSGTLYQNHVKEVFNVLNLVRPNFLKTDHASSIKRRIMSKVELSGRKMSQSDDHFYEAVERTILDNKDLKRKIHVIQDLREMTRKILHYYKGDSLDELPGLVDFTVFLELSERQKKDIEVLKKCNSRFRIFSEGSAIYVHPGLNSALKQSGADVEKMDLLLQNQGEVGAKARFFLNLLGLCESTGEKLLVFSQYLGPLKFLERLTVKVKNYNVGREIFVITGDSNSETRDSSMEQFNKSSSSRVFFGSIKACGEGISLVGASRIIILDVHLNPSVTRQAIGRAFRPGQERKVYTYRLVASGSPEEEDHRVCFRKECIAKMWFEWNGSYRGLTEFVMESVDVNNCGDLFLETKLLKAGVVSVCKRWCGKEAEQDAYSFVPVLGDINGTADQIEQPSSDKPDSMGSGGHLEIKSGEEVHKKKGRKPRKVDGSVKKKKRNVDLESDPEYSPPKSHKRAKK